MAIEETTEIKTEQMKEISYREKILKKTNRVKKVLLGLTVFYILLISIFLCISYYFNDKITVNEFSIYGVLFSLIFIIYFSTSCLSFLKSYREVIHIISDEDLAPFEALNKSRSFIQEYFPSFIIYSGKIRLFRFRNKSDFDFKDLAEISIKTFYNRSGQNHTVIFKKLNGNTFVFGISNNVSQQRYLTQSAQKYNPDILILH